MNILAIDPGNVLSGYDQTTNIEYGAPETVTVTVEADERGKLSVTDITGADPDGQTGRTVQTSGEGSALVTGTTTVTNTYKTATVKVYKVVEGLETDYDTAFDFTAAFDPAYDESVGASATFSLYDKTNGPEPEAGETPVALKEQVFTNVPYGTVLSIAEVRPEAPFELTGVKVVDGEGNALTPTAAATEERAPAYTGNTDEVIFT